MENVSRLSYLKHKYLRCCSFHLFILLGTIQFFNFSILEAKAKANAEENTPIPIGSSSFIISFMGHDITVETFKPSTYVDQPLLIVMPGVVRSATNGRNDAIGLACKCSCLVAVPHLSTENFPTSGDYDHGAVFPNDAYDPVTGALHQDTHPNPQDQWSLNVVLSVLHHVRSKESNANLKYYLFGDGAGGQFINAFALFLYPLLPTHEQPERMVIANLGVVTFPGLPIMKQDAVHVNRDACYTGPNRQLTTRREVKQGYPDYCCLTEALINRHYNFPQNPFIFEDKSRFCSASRCQLPYPFGLGNIVPMPNLEQYLDARLTFFMGERDVNVNGGINPNCEVIFPIDHGTYDLIEGPFRLFKNLNCYLTGHALAQRFKMTCDWKALVAFDCDHNAAAMLKAQNAAQAIFGDKTCEFIRNCHYLSQYVVPGAHPLPPSSNAWKE